MRVWMVTQWFDPEPTFKGLLFAKELQRRGHEVEVVTGFPNYPGGRVYDGYRIRAYQREVVDGIVVHRVPLYPSHDASARKRVLNYVSFASTSALKLLSGRRPDVIYAYHPPGTVALPVAVARLVRGVPFVYDVQDLWPDTLAATGMLREGRVTRLVGRAMERTYGLASHVVVLSEGFRSRLVERGVPVEKLTVIPNWAPEHEVLVEEPGPARRRLALDGTFNVVFAGAMGPAQQLDVIIDAAELLQVESDVRFVLLGSGMDESRLKALVTERRLDNVQFLARRPPSEVGEVLAAGDALLVHLRPDPLFEITVPSKTQTYLYAGKPVLMGVRGDAARMVTESGAGICFEPGNAADLARAVRELAQLSSAARIEMGRAGRRYYDEHLSLRVGSDAFATVLEAAARQRHAWQRTKRGIDVAVSATALAVLAAPGAVVAALVRSRLGSPVLFRQQRPGRHGRPFTMVKFRTMTADKDGQGHLLPDAARLTPFGSWLRTTSLDELPELWNVLKGDMSIVGPRPLLERYTPWFTEEESRRLDVRPGVTGLAQVHGRNEAAWDERLALDVDYVRTISPLRDLRIVWATVAQVFRRSGAVSDPTSIMRDLDVERAARAGGR